MLKTDEHYQAWSFALRATAELLLRGNSADQWLYADIAPPEEWQGNAISVWSGSSGSRMVPRLRIGDMTSLWVWDGQFDVTDPEAQNVLEELWPDAADKPLQETVYRLAGHIGVRLEGVWDGEPESRFSAWSRLFCAAVDCLPLLHTAQPWFVRTFFHGGWGTYYLEFRPMSGRASFALSEEGHIAKPDLPSERTKAVENFTIRPAIRAGMSRQEVTALLLPALQVCIDAAERNWRGSDLRASTKPIRIRDGVVDETLQKLSLGDLGYNEAWLQELLAAHPEVLPVAEIEPAFERLVPAGREIACGHGYIDNLFLTGGGDIVVVETKLHANSQARREVVAQTLDYVAALSSMTLEQFEAAVCAAQHLGERPTSLHALVAQQPEALDECTFADAVAANLARGRMLALVVGDGIRREAETLAGVLQSHAGSHFTFALVELSIYRMGDGDLFVVPSTLAKTLMIERAVVRVDRSNGGVVVEAVEEASASAASVPRSLTDIQFDEMMDQRQPGLADQIRKFVGSLEPLGVYPELRGSLNLKAEVGGEKPVNFGYIQKNGQLWTDAASWKMPMDTALEYLTSVARLIGGEVVHPHKSPYVAITGTKAPRIENLLPQHALEWRQAIEQTLHRLRSENACRD